MPERINAAESITVTDIIPHFKINLVTGVRALKVSAKKSLTLCNIHILITDYILL